MSYFLTVRLTEQDCRCGQRRHCLQQGQSLFRRFHRFPDSKIIRRPCRRVIPKVLVKLGRLRGLIYSSDRGQPGCDRTFIHFVETPPLLVCDPEGTQLYVIGGDYRVTHRGIEG
jgi:hypothetical protein